MTLPQKSGRKGGREKEQKAQSGNEMGLAKKIRGKSPEDGG